MGDLEQQERDFQEVLAYLRGSEWEDGYSPDDVNEVRADEIVTDFLDSIGWHLRHDWELKLETFIWENYEAYGVKPL